MRAKATCGARQARLLLPVCRAEQASEAAFARAMAVAAAAQNQHTAH